MKFYVIINRQLNLMSCSLSSMCFLSVVFSCLCAHMKFYICVPGNHFCLCNLFWIGQFAATNSVCLLFLPLFWDFPINCLASILAVQKKVFTWSDRTIIGFSYHENLTLDSFLDFPPFILYKLWNAMAYVAWEAATLYKSVHISFSPLCISDITTQLICYIFLGLVFLHQFTVVAIFIWPLHMFDTLPFLHYLVVFNFVEMFDSVVSTNQCNTKVSSWT